MNGNRFILHYKFFNYILYPVLLSFCLYSCTKTKQTEMDLDSPSVVIIPDIQYYTRWDEYSFQLNYINGFLDRNKSNVELCLQTGDMTDCNSLNEWTKVSSFVSKIPSSINFIPCFGNHDYGDNGKTDSRISNYPQSILNNKYLVSKYRDNFAYLIKIDGNLYGVLVLEFGCVDDSLEWAEYIVRNYLNTPFIVLTHAFLNDDGELYNSADSTINNSDSPKKYYPSNLEYINDSKDIFDKLIKKNPNIDIIISGHSCPQTGIVTKQLYNDNNELVNCITANYQCYDLGGNGNIAILQIKSDELIVYQYSTIHNTSSSYIKLSRFN